MKTILFCVALGALCFGGSLRMVETRAQPVPRVVEIPPPLIPDPPAEEVGITIEEPLETHIVSRANPSWRKKKPIVKTPAAVREADLDYSTFSRYAPLGRRSVPPPPAPATID